MIGRDELMAAAQRQYDVVRTPLGEVRIRSLTSYEDGERESAQLDDDGRIDLDEYPLAKARMLMMSIVDGQGNRLFSNDDIESIANWRCDVINPIFSACKKLNRLDDEPLEEMAKNSEPTTADDSPSD